MTHDFATSLRMSQAQADAPWWGEVYRQAFPAFAGMTYVGANCPAQRDGVDRLVTTDTGHVYRVDEKVRGKDYDDFFLEFWSVEEKKERGWIAKALACDFIAYAFIPSARCYLLPFASLRRAWGMRGKEWVAKYGPRRVPNRGYTTVGVPVPIATVLDAIRDGMLIRWTATVEAERLGVIAEAETTMATAVAPRVTVACVTRPPEPQLSLLDRLK